jgi:hypothetical protein
MTAVMTGIQKSKLVIEPFGVITEAHGKYLQSLSAAAGIVVFVAVVFKGLSADCRLLSNDGSNDMGLSDCRRDGSEIQQSGESGSNEKLHLGRGRDRELVVTFERELRD